MKCFFLSKWPYSPGVPDPVAAWLYGSDARRGNEHCIMRGAASYVHLRVASLKACGCSLNPQLSEPCVMVEVHLMVMRLCGYGMFCGFVNISAFCCSFVSPNKFHVLTVKQLFLCVRWTSLWR